VPKSQSSCEGIFELETFTKPKRLLENQHYHNQRQKSLCRLTDDMIDAPIVKVINALNKISHCFSLQCCYGHFLYSGQNNPHNLHPLPMTDTISKVEYKIAYVAFCIENTLKGRSLLKTLQGIPVIDPENIQFCSASWFWERQVNSYVLQVEPSRFKDKDKAIFSYNEALNIEKTRNEFFTKLEELFFQQ